jgi:hypothetical protein
MSQPIQEGRDSRDEAPPFLGTWTRVYVAVLSYLLALIVFLYIFSRLWVA